MCLAPHTFLLASVSLAILIFAAAIYCITISRNLIRILIGVEIFTKAVTLLLLASGVATGNMGISQSVMITVIVIEVVVIAVAAGVVIGAYRRTGSLDPRTLVDLRG